MQTPQHKDQWVESLRGIIKSTCGSAWRITNGKGKFKLDVRLEDNTRRYKTFNIPWDKAHARRIQETVEQIHLFTTQGLSIDEALKRVAVSSDPKIKKKPDPKILLNAFAEYEKYKVETLGMMQKTWNKEYGGEKHIGITPPRKKATGKTYSHLLRVADSENSEELFARLAPKVNQPGVRIRQQVIRYMASFLRWATSYESNYLLDKKYRPFEKGGAGTYIGKKSAERIKKDNEKERIPIMEEDIRKLLASIPINQKHKLNAKRARAWKLAIELLSAYGLRPEEVPNLEIIEGSLWSMWIKKTDGGTGKPRKLFCFTGFDKEWDLVNRFKKEKLPEVSEFTGFGESLSNYLERNKTWEEMKNKKGYTSRSFRHGYSWITHKITNLSSNEISKHMGHTEETHIGHYSKWFSEEDLEASYKKGMKFIEKQKEDE